MDWGAELSGTQFDATSKYYDPKATREKPVWDLVDIRFVKKLAEPYTLARIRANPKLQSMVVLSKGSRLSVTPVSPEHGVLIGGQ